ncbi:MAG: hypothetical protein ACYCWW_04975 [Deltaproteobacteria bacterium]
MRTFLTLKPPRRQAATRAPLEEAPPPEGQPSRLARLATWLLLTFVALAPGSARAFWLLGFSTAETQPPWSGSFIGGTGGQLTVVDGVTSYTPFLAHAGLRVGILNDLDVGYRLTTVALPYNQGGPVLGSQLDAKLRITPEGASWRFAAGLDGAFAYLDFTGTNEAAYSPGTYAILSHRLRSGVDGSLEGRYAYTLVPQANGNPANDLHAIGGSAGLKIELGKGTALRPEIGLFDFVGHIAGRAADGFGLQYGAVFSALAW